MPGLKRSSARLSCGKCVAMDISSRRVLSHREPIDRWRAISAGPVNINTADAGQLDTLPGIGPALAQRIMQYRELEGPFKSLDDLKNVSGIGGKKYEDLKDRITL